MFGREHDRLIRIVPCGEGEPVCSDESTDPEGPFCFFYSTLFQIILLCLPLFSFERALLTEINVVPAELHPNSWAFVRTFSILGSHFGVDVFLYFFEAKRPGRTLWVSFNGVAGRSLLSLFQQSYKSFKKMFFKIRSTTKGDPTLLDGFLCIGPKNLSFRALDSWMTYPHLNVRCASISPTSMWFLILPSWFKRSFPQ